MATGRPLGHVGPSLFVLALAVSGCGPSIVPIPTPAVPSPTITTTAEGVGDLEIVTTTSGEALDPDGYAVTVDGVQIRTMTLDQRAALTGVKAGAPIVELKGLASNCRVARNPRIVQIAAGAPARTEFAVACYPSIPGRIVWSRHREIGGQQELWTMDPIGEDARQLTQHTVGKADLYPAVSRDGRKVVFVRSDDIWVMNGDGTGQTEVMRHPARDWSPTWSPDGRRIAFYSDRDGNFEIYTMNADGSGLTRLTNDPGDDNSPDWSPDGASILFLSGRGDGVLSVHVMRPDGTGVTRLTDHPFEENSARWSPDGKRVAFARSLSSNTRRDLEIFVMNADGAGLVRLTDNIALEGAPDWSPDGRWLLFISRRDGDNDIFLMKADGSAASNLTRDPAMNDVTPRWWPPVR